jgi:hypothetical protein
VTDDESLGADPADHRLDGEAMKAVPPDPPLLAPLPRDRVCRRLGGDRAVERRVEDGDVRNVRERSAGVVDPAQRRVVVQRRDRTQLLDPADDVVVDPRRLDEARAAVDDAVADRLGRDERVDRVRFRSVDEMELQARRARVDGENN